LQDFIKGDGSLNFKILKVLCLTQFSKDEKSFIKDANEVILWHPLFIYLLLLLFLFD